MMAIAGLLALRCEVKGYDVQVRFRQRFLVAAESGEEDATGFVDTERDVIDGDGDIVGIAEFEFFGVLGDAAEHLRKER
jgi:hypothetical protein